MATTDINYRALRHYTWKRSFPKIGIKVWYHGQRGKIELKSMTEECIGWDSTWQGVWKVQSEMCQHSSSHKYKSPGQMPKGPAELLLINEICYRFLGRRCGNVHCTMWCEYVKEVGEMGACDPWHPKLRSKQQLPAETTRKFTGGFSELKRGDNLRKRPLRCHHYHT